MFIAMDKDGSIWAFSKEPRLDLEEDCWIPEKNAEYFSLPEEACSGSFSWDCSLRKPECNDYEIAQEEIFEINGFSYQCLPALQHSCNECAFKSLESICLRAPECLGVIRSDRTDIYFKALD